MRIESICCLCSFAASTAVSLSLLVAACTGTRHGDGTLHADPAQAGPDRDCVIALDVAH
jgi:hypothetical protein